MRLRPTWRQSRRQCPGIVVSDWDGIDEVADDAYCGVGVGALQQCTLLQCVAITDVGSKGLKTARLQPFGVIVDLIDDVIGCLGEGFLGIVRHDQEPKAAREANAACWAMLLLQFGYIPIVNLAVPARHRETIAETDRAAQRGCSKATKPDRRIGLLDRRRCNPNVLEVEKFALEGDRLSCESTAQDLERLVGACAALLRRHTHPFKLFP